MLPKEKRLKKKKDFEKVFKNSRSFKEGLFILKIRENNLKTSRFGFVVSQRVSKKAVVRNKIKRRLREAAREWIKNNLSDEKNGSKESADAVIIALPGSEKKDFSELKEAVTKLFKKSNV